MTTKFMQTVMKAKLLDLFLFPGRRISVEEIDHEPGCYDAGISEAGSNKYRYAGEK
jgi:hypothetical protein